MALWAGQTEGKGRAGPVSAINVTVLGSLFSCRRCDKETTCELSVTARALSIFLLRAQ
jgi:hypothetical protein